MTHAPTLLLTGGAGFIGSHFAGMMVREGWRVLILDKLTYAGHRANLADIPAGNHASDPGWELVEGDIAAPGLAEKILHEHKPEALVHMAAESHVDLSITGPEAFLHTNITGTFRLLEAARHYYGGLTGTAKDAFRFIHVSTDEVFGELGAEGHFSESSPYAPNSPYSATKAGSDHLASAWHRTYGLPVIITHCSNNYGPRQYPEKLIPLMIRRALAGEPLPVYGDGRQVRDWIHVEDHCAGVRLAWQKGRVGEHYCFGGHSERANIDIVRQICALLDAKRPRPGGAPHADLIRFVTDRPGHDRRYAIDDAKAQRELGFTRRITDFAHGLEETVDWYLTHPEWAEEVMKKPESGV